LMDNHTITREELKKMIDTKADFRLIDVRSPPELKHGMIPTAKHIPLGELNEALALPPEEFESRYHFPKMREKDVVVFYCKSGGRSRNATLLAVEKGFNARNYAGSIWEWSQHDPHVKRYGVSFM